MFADRLKKSLLQAAIQGKLTDRLPTDGDARDLLKKIRAEKAKLIAAKKIKPEKPLPPVTEDEIPFDLPANWCWCRLGDIALKIHYGFTASANSTGNVKLLRITDIQDDKVNWRKVPRCEVTESQKKEYLLRDGNIVIARTGGTVGKTFVVENLSEDAVFASYLIRLVFDENISSLYVKLFSGSPLYWKQIVDKSQGTGQPNVNGKSLSNLIIPLPPLAEQLRIVERLDELLSEVDELAKDERELNLHVKNFPRRMKNSLLQAAIQGQLTEQLPSDGDARDLLKKIRDEKAKLIAAKKIKPEKPLPPVTDDEIPFDLPANWCWCRLGDIGTWGAGATPLKGNPAFYENATIPWLVTGDLNDGLITNVPGKISALALEKTSVKLNPVNSVLVAMYGATIGKIGLLTFPATTNQACCACQTFTGIKPWYLMYFLKFQRREFIKQGVGGAQPNISKEKIVNTLFPLPPLAEQLRIVERLDELLPLCEIEKSSEIFPT
ncbi:MAG: restriction endonuclease subunit S [Selenomonadaceae bacterium]|nr:restriction endonuclease subunit S [Selenomonadaceae bacterium]